MTVRHTVHHVPQRSIPSKRCAANSYISLFTENLEVRHDVTWQLGEILIQSWEM